MQREDTLQAGTAGGQSGQRQEPRVSAAGVAQPHGGGKGRLRPLVKCHVSAMRGSPRSISDSIQKYQRSISVRLCLFFTIILDLRKSCRNNIENFLISLSAQQEHQLLPALQRIYLRLSNYDDNHYKQQHTERSSRCLKKFACVSCFNPHINPAASVLSMSPSFK